jgi:S-adenosylmethionine hydrolase
MSKTLTIKLTMSGPSVGPFNISDQFGNVIAIDVPKKTLVRGISYTVNDNVSIIVIESTGKCKFKKSFAVSTFDILTYANTGYTQTTTACIWRHLTNIRLYIITFYKT